MEWVETTAKSLDDAKTAALDQLGVAADEAEFDIVEEPRPGLFGRTRGEARVRARVKPAQVRPKNERRRRSSKGRGGSSKGSASESSSASTETNSGDEAAPPSPTADTSSSNGSGRGRQSKKQPKQPNQRNEKQEPKMSDQNESRPESDVSPQEVGEAAVAFMEGLVTAFGGEGTTSLAIDGTELDVTVSGEELGLMVGPGGRTLNAIQDLARVSSQRRLGDHETRLRIDVAGYRERRSAALTRFAADVASQVRESGVARSLEPMSSADRKVIHDAVNDEDGVESRSEGDDPNRRVVVVPA